jgi:hypothetical protein
MKKTHKLLSLVLAAAMICGTCLPVMAEDTSSSSSSSSSTKITNPVIKVVKDFKVGANHNATEATFKFDVTSGGENVGSTISKLTVSAGPLDALPKKEVSYTYYSTQKAGASGVLTQDSESFDFSGVADKVSDVGVYEYTVSESTVNADGSVTSGANQHIYPENPWAANESAGSNKYTVDVFVLKNDTTGKFYIDSVMLTYPNQTAKPSELKFVNVYDTTTLKIAKEVGGNAGEKNRDFTFYICIPEGGKTLTLTKDQVFTAKKYDSAGHEIGTVDIKVNGDYTTATGLAIKNDAKETIATERDFTTNEFTLKDGEYIELEAPVGMIYFLREKDYSTEGYVTTVDYAHTSSASDTTGITGKELTYHLEEGQLTSGYNAVTYHNTKDATVATGVDVEVLPYVLIVAVALAGCLVLLFKKRRTVR